MKRKLPPSSARRNGNGDHRRPSRTAVPSKANSVKTTEDSVISDPSSSARMPVREGRNGGRLLSGNPSNRGGGRTSELRERLLSLSAERGVDLIEEMQRGEITYKLNGVCSHCGKPSKGPAEFGDLLKLIPSPDTRLRAADLPLKYTIGREHVIRIEGFDGAQAFFDVVRQRIRRTLPMNAAEALIVDIQLAVKEQI